MDALRNDTAAQRTLPNEYSELLQSTCGGHALWAPRKTARGGGALGDVGYIAHGSFVRLFNVFRDPPDEVPALLFHASSVYEGEHFAMPIMQSSQDCTIEFRVNGTATVASMPLATVSVEPKITLTRKRIAFLAPPKPARTDFVNPMQVRKFRDWLTRNRHRLPHGVVLITQIVRSPGWVAGIATGRQGNTSVEASTSVGSLVRIGAGSSMTYELARLARSQGPDPDEWSTERADYTLVVRYTTVCTRAERMLQKIKLALFSSDSGDLPEVPITSSSTTVRPPASASPSGSNSFQSNSVTRGLQDDVDVRKKLRGL